MSDSDNANGCLGNLLGMIALGFVIALYLNGIAERSGNKGQGVFALFSSKRDRCPFIQGQQYPYDWRTGNQGACVRVLPDRWETRMVPDSIGGLFMVPEQVRITGGVSIETPEGSGTGRWNGPGNVIGTITDNTGSYPFACDGIQVTGRSRGVCYWTTN